ncbi:MAG: hypothetical protein QY321_01155 [Patescibacteria group bacterium]|nr:MAG: hypothetical protein QY321_01155 [Patescibacteria group bacterium]
MTDYSPAVDQLITRLMKEQGIDDTDSSAKEKFREETMDRINNYILNRIPDDRLIEFETLLQENVPDRISAFLEEVLSGSESELGWTA